jgi:hypothetical protein
MTAFKEMKYAWIPKKCQAIGMRGVLNKPVAQKGLIAQVKKCLDQEYLDKMQNQKRLNRVKSKVSSKSKNKLKQSTDKI